MRPGRTVALVGPTGAGKSTLASLLVRLVDPDDRARSSYDDLDVRELAPGGARRRSPRSCRSRRSCSTTPSAATSRSAPTSPTRTSGPRCASRRPTASSPRCPRALDTVVGERGTTLSGGQRQRLALARAVVRRPRLLVLDDATSSVDPQVEQRILAGLRDAGLPSTVVVVAYRRATIALADEVVFVEDGRVTARGTHEELSRTSAGYQDLVHGVRAGRGRARRRRARRPRRSRPPTAGG